MLSDDYRFQALGMPGYLVDFNLVDKQKVPIHWGKNLEGKISTTLMKNLEN